MTRECRRVQRLRVRDGYFRDTSGKPVYLIGANFWPKRTGPWMYRDRFESSAVASDLRELAALGANVVRIFCFLPDFLPTPDVVDEKARERLGAVIELAANAGMWSIPTFLVGHMSGENWAPEWSKGRNWYTDSLLLDASGLLIGSIASHFAGDARIAAWLLTNEWPLFAGTIGSEQSERWAKRLIDVLRAADPECNVSVGDGAWDLIGGERGVPNTGALRELVDFVGPHFYPKETDSLRHAAFAGFAMKMLKPLDRPVLLEEFGCSSDQADDVFAAGYYRSTLWSAFGAGNCGTLIWNSHDFMLENRAPYSHHPYELHFGVIRTDGSRKPQAAEFQRFAAYAVKHNPDEWEPLRTTAAIGRTSYYATDFPFDWGWSKLELRDLFLQAYSSAVQAGLDVGFIDLRTAHPSQATTLFIPCLQQVTTEDAAGVERFVREGGTVYISYGGEPWFPELGRFVGARLLIRYGLVEQLAEDLVHMRFVRNFGGIAQDAKLEFTILGAARRSAPMRCEPEEAKVVATDPNGNPVLLERTLGAGRIIFLTYPIEYFQLNGLDGNGNSDLAKIYKAVAVLGRALPVARSTSDQVQIFVWRSKQDPKQQRLLLINHSWQRVVTEIVGSPTSLRDLESGEPMGASIALEAKGVRFFETTDVK